MSRFCPGIPGSTLEVPSTTDADTSMVRSNPSVFATFKSRINDLGLTRAKKAFYKMDKDGNGELSPTEFSRLFRKLMKDYPVTDMAVQDIFLKIQSCAEDGSEHAPELSFATFLAFLDSIK